MNTFTNFSEYFKTAEKPVEATNEEAVILLKKYIRNELNAYGKNKVLPENLENSLRAHLSNNDIERFFSKNKKYFPNESNSEADAIEQAAREFIEETKEEKIKDTVTDSAENLLQEAKLFSEEN